MDVSNFQEIESAHFINGTGMSGVFIKGARRTEASASIAGVKVYLGEHGKIPFVVIVSSKDGMDSTTLVPMNVVYKVVPLNSVVRQAPKLVAVKKEPAVKQEPAAKQ